MCWIRFEQLANEALAFDVECKQKRDADQTERDQLALHAEVEVAYGEVAVVVCAALECHGGGAHGLSGAVCAAVCAAFYVNLHASRRRNHVLYVAVLVCYLVKLMFNNLNIFI